MIRGRAEYKLFLIGNKGLKGVGIFLANISVDKVIDISRVTDRMIVINPYETSPALENFWLLAYESFSH